MTDGYHEYYLCGDRSLESLVRDQVLAHQKFEKPPEDIRDRMVALAEILKVSDPYNVCAITDLANHVFTYRVEITGSFSSQQLMALEEDRFDFDNVIPRGETIAIYIKERK